MSIPIDFLCSNSMSYEDESYMFLDDELAFIAVNWVCLIKNFKAYTMLYEVIDYFEFIRSW